MERPTCATCPFWKNERDGLFGECRRYAPDAMVTFVNYVTAYSVWPTTTREHWCGDHPDSPAHVASLKARPQPDAPPDRFVFGCDVRGPAPPPPSGYC